MPDLQPVGRENNEIPAPTTAAAITSVVSHDNRAFSEREEHDETSAAPTNNER